MPESAPLTFEAFRTRLAEILRGLEHPPLGTAAALAEECGEVSSLLLEHYAYGKELDPTALASELMDVVTCVCEIATLHGVDLDVAARAKVEDLGARAPKWREQLQDALRRSREQ